jgi:hypothetical protein
MRSLRRDRSTCRSWPALASWLAAPTLTVAAAANHATGGRPVASGPQLPDQPVTSSHELDHASR